MKEKLENQLNFPDIRWKVPVIILITLSVVMTVLSLLKGWPLPVFLASMAVYIGSLVYFIIESIRLKSYLVIATFLGMIAIGVYVVWFRFQV